MAPCLLIDLQNNIGRAVVSMIMMGMFASETSSRRLANDAWLLRNRRHRRMLFYLDDAPLLRNINGGVVY